MCLIVNNKVSPIGNVFNFSDSKESKRPISKFSEDKEKDRDLDGKTKTMINLVLDPLKSYFNPLEHILSDSEVNNGLEHLFSLDSLGIDKNDKELVSFDKGKIDQFRQGIEFKDGYYNVVT